MAAATAWRLTSSPRWWEPCDRSWRRCQEHGYREFARPILRDVFEALGKQGAPVFAIPAMLFAAGYAKNDIPSVLNTYTAETGLPIDYGRELGVDRLMVAAAGARVRECLDAATTDVPLSETLLVVVGRGSSDPDANSNVAKVTRMLVEGFGFGWGETVYSGVTFPWSGLRHVIRLGFRRIVVPYFLFSGVLVSRIRQHTERVAKDHPEVEFLSAGYLDSIRWWWTPSGNGWTKCCWGHRHELLTVQIQGPGARLRTRRRLGTGKPSPPCGRSRGVLHAANRNAQGPANPMVFRSPPSPPAQPWRAHHHPSTYADHPLGPRTLQTKDSSQRIKRSVSFRVAKSTVSPATAWIFH